MQFDRTQEQKSEMYVQKIQLYYVNIQHNIYIILSFLTRCTFSFNTNSRIIDEGHTHFHCWYWWCFCSLEFHHKNRNILNLIFDGCFDYFELHVSIMWRIIYTDHSQLKWRDFFFFVPLLMWFKTIISVRLWWDNILYNKCWEIYMTRQATLLKKNFHKLKLIFVGTFLHSFHSLEQLRIFSRAFYLYLFPFKL